ncbi:MAG: hypothetical protein Q9188_005336 [Gyalolechia gomerana]
MQPRSSTHTPTPRLYYLLLFFLFIYLWRWTNGWHRFLCSDSGKPTTTAPQPNHESSSRQPPPLHNPHEPLVVECPTIEYIDLDNASFTNGKDRVLILTPLRDAASHLETHFRLLYELTYAHEKIDLAFLVGDSEDDTLALLQDELKRLQAPSNPSRFNSVMVVEKDFGDDLPQGVEDRHSFKAQGTRRKGIGRARNYLLYAALKPEHRWVYWRDVDIVENPETIIEDLMMHNRDLYCCITFTIDFLSPYPPSSPHHSNILPSTSNPTISPNPSTKPAKTGYKEYRTHRTYLAWQAHSSPSQRLKHLHKAIPLDGIGGVNILVKADVHRSGINFPCYAFENQADTEGFAAMARRAGYGVWGLPNYVVWHVDTQEKEGNLKGKKGGRDGR